MKNRLIRIVLIVILLPIVGFAAAGMMSKPPENLGVVDGKLAPCPAASNCVCTDAEIPEHEMAPWSFAGSPQEAEEDLIAVLQANPRTKIVAQSENYIHAEVRSLVFRFVDDVEFLIDGATKQIQFRSASRVGRMDFGSNRQRMESLKAAFEARQKSRSAPAA